MFTIHDEVAFEDLGEGTKRKILSYADNMMAVEVHLEKGAEGKPHTHPHEQIGYVVKGKISYREEGVEKAILKAGDSYYVPPKLEHGVLALEDTILLDVFTPMREDFLK